MGGADNKEERRRQFQTQFCRRRLETFGELLLFKPEKIEN